MAADKDATGSHLLPTRRLICAALLVASALAVSAAPAAAAGLRFTARPAVLPATGGIVRLHVGGAARACHLSARGVHVPRQACGNVRVRVAANRAGGTRRLVFVVHAGGRTLKRVVLEQAVTNNQPSSSGNPPTRSASGSAPGVAPAITTQPSSMTVPYGFAVTLSAAASGTPAPSVRWQVSVDGGVTWANTSPTFTATAPMSGYAYHAIFTNTGGSVTSVPVTLTVQPASTLNFSGYEDYAPAGQQFTAVSASWVVPAINCPPGVYSYAAEWPGIGDSTSVEQDGTWSDCWNGTALYSAWYEIYGDPDLNNGYAIPLSSSNYPVSAGDHISASVNLVGTNWNFAMSDSTRNWTWSTSVASPSSVTLNQGSAEWIVEDPNGCSPSCQTLAQFSPVTFTGASATMSGSSGTISGFPAAADQIVAASGSTLLAAPGPLDAAGDSFTDTWYAS